MFKGIYCSCDLSYRTDNLELSATPLTLDSSYSSDLTARCQWCQLTLSLLRYLTQIFTHLKLCLATATHNFKWVKKIHICLIWDQTFENPDVKTLISFPIAVT